MEKKAPEPMEPVADQCPGCGYILNPETGACLSCGYKVDMFIVIDEDEDVLVP